METNEPKHVRVSKALHKQLRGISYQTDRTLGDVSEEIVRLGIRAFLQKDKLPNQFEETAISSPTSG